MTPELHNRKKLIPGPDHPITIEPTDTRVLVTIAGLIIADSTRALTLREANYPSRHYLPLTDIDEDLLIESSSVSSCPYKGEAEYFRFRETPNVETDIAWTYRTPHEAVHEIAELVAFYPEHAVIKVGDS